MIIRIKLCVINDKQPRRTVKVRRPVNSTIQYLKFFIIYTSLFFALATVPALSAQYLSAVWY